MDMFQCVFPDYLYYLLWQNQSRKLMNCKKADQGNQSSLIDYKLINAPLVAGIHLLSNAKAKEVLHVQTWTTADSMVTEAPTGINDAITSQRPWQW